VRLLLNCDNFYFGVRRLHHVADLLADERLRQRREIGQRAARRIALVFADDTIGLRRPSSRTKVTVVPKATSEGLWRGVTTCAVARRAVQ
jgi:hypothetical protein